MTQKLTISARILPDGATVKVIGRDAWALRNLVNAGSQGCTPIDHPGPRWSQYVFKLRGFGFAIETIDEKHGGQFAGSHARYVLRSQVEIIEDSDARRAA
ncbi:winged helix domain-containing protein [Rhizobium sp. HT1-10]|uniref:winged helix domain-containing protein n=1 Tax=Rhizobium sp. HT1-10 TaxID=3111638 RepID=UPI003C271FBC